LKSFNFTLMSSGVIGAQYGSTKAQNLLGVSFLGSAGFAVSFTGRICSFCKGSKDKTFSDLTFGIPISFPDSDDCPGKDVFNFFAERPSFPRRPRFSGDPGP
jgi:hypothetical protein